MQFFEHLYATCATGGSKGRMILWYYVLSAGFFTLANRTTFQAMEEERVVPDVIDKAPPALLDVKYLQGGVFVNLGNILRPTEVQDQPLLNWNADPNKLYLLCMTDPDAPSRQNPVNGEWQHWLVGNIPGNHVSQGEILTQFVGSGPAKGTGLHRYVFLIYEQPHELRFDEKRLKNRSDEGRPKSSIREFAKKYNLGHPIAGNFYQAEWDEFVPILNRQLGVQD